MNIAHGFIKLATGTASSKRVYGFSIPCRDLDYWMQIYKSESKGRKRTHRRNEIYAIMDKYNISQNTAIRAMNDAIRLTNGK